MVTTYHLSSKAAAAGRGLYALLVGFLFVTSIPHVDGHGIEVRHCLTTAGDLRIFVEHWHNDLSSVGEA